jgi:hypothetical protein
MLGRLRIAYLGERVQDVDVWYVEVCSLKCTRQDDLKGGGQSGAECR